MRVRDLQEFLSTFTARDKSGTKQGNAISDAVIFVEVNGFLEEIKKMEVYEEVQTHPTPVSYTHLTLPTIYSV